MFDDADDIHPLFAGAPSTTEFKKLRKRIVRQTREAIEQYGMVDPSAHDKDGKQPRWLVCLSGGKDSYTLLAILYELKWRGLLPVDLLACNLDQGQPGFPATVLPEFLDRMGVQHRIEYQDTYSVVMDKVPQGRTYCAPVFETAPRQPVSHRQGRRLFRRRAGPSPRRYSRDVFYEPFSWRASGHHATETGERRRRSVCLPPACTCCRS